MTADATTAAQVQPGKRRFPLKGAYLGYVLALGITGTASTAAMLMLTAGGYAWSTAAAGLIAVSLGAAVAAVATTIPTWQSRVLDISLLVACVLLWVWVPFETVFPRAALDVEPALVTCMFAATLISFLAIALTGYHPGDPLWLRGALIVRWMCMAAFFAVSVAAPHFSAAPPAFLRSFGLGVFCIVTAVDLAWASHGHPRHRTEWKHPRPHLATSVFTAVSPALAIIGGGTGMTSTSRPVMALLVCIVLCLLMRTVATLNEHGRLMRRVHERRERFSELLDHSLDVVGLCDPQTLTILYVSPAAERILGCEVGDVLGEPLNELLHCGPNELRRYADQCLLDSSAGQPAEFIVHGRTVALVFAAHDDGLVFTIRDVHETVVLRSQWEELAYTDELTGLRTREYLPRFAEQLVSAGHAHCTALFIDLDRFKPVNDAHGHETGDAILREVAHRLLANTPQDAVACRLGGDEFVVLSPGELESTQADQLSDALSAPYVLPDLVIRISASVGVAHAPADTPIETLLGRSDTAMYEVKQRFAARDALAAVASVASSFEARDHVGRADDHELEHGCQRVMRVDGTTAGYKCVPLLGGRPHPDPGAWSLPGPAELRTMGDVWDLMGPMKPVGEYLNVPVSAEDLLPETLTLPILDVCYNHRGPTGGFGVELLPSPGAYAFDIVLPALQAIRDMGVHIYLDQAGSHYAVIDLLMRLPLDGVRISSWLVNQALDDPGARSCLEGLISVCTIADFEVTCTGVDSDSAFDMACSLGTHSVIGDYAAPPFNLFTLSRRAHILGEPTVEPASPSLPIDQP